MPRKALKRSKTNTIKKDTKKCKPGLNKGSLAAHLSMQLGQVSLFVRNHQSPTLNLANSSRFQALLDSEAEESQRNVVAMEAEAIDFDFGVENRDDKEFILSQDFFWYFSSLKFDFYEF